MNNSEIILEKIRELILVLSFENNKLDNYQEFFNKVTTLDNMPLSFYINDERINYIFILLIYHKGKIYSLRNNSSFQEIKDNFTLSNFQRFHDLNEAEIFYSLLFKRKKIKEAIADFNEIYLFELIDEKLYHIKYNCDILKDYIYIEREANNG